MILTTEQQQPNDDHNILKEDTKKKQFAPTLCNIYSLQCCQTPPSLACDYYTVVRIIVQVFLSFVHFAFPSMQ